MTDFANFCRHSLSTFQIFKNITWHPWPRPQSVRLVSFAYLFILASISWKTLENCPFLPQFTYLFNSWRSFPLAWCGLWQMSLGSNRAHLPEQTVSNFFWKFVIHRARSMEFKINFACFQHPDISLFQSTGTKSHFNNF